MLASGDKPPVSVTNFSSRPRVKFIGKEERRTESSMEAAHCRKTGYDSRSLSVSVILIFFI